MAKVRTTYVCRGCGAIQARWMGKCPDCGVWDALEKVVASASATAGNSALATELDAIGGWTAGATLDSGATEHGELDELTESSPSAAARLRDVPRDDVERLASGIGELDRVLGGGLVPGSVVLVGGDPGIGKSTLLLQAMAGLAAGPDAGRRQRILYGSSEESARQIRLRAERLLASPAVPGETAAVEPWPLVVAEHLYVLSETNLSRIVEQARRIRPAVLVVDSLQMVHRPGVDAAPGSVTQLRRCCIELVHLAKRTGTAVLIVGHVTKDGQLAGPRLVEHLVDVVLSFEGDRHHSCRLVRATKNRFGDTMEIGLFEMTGAGLRELADPGSAIDPNATPGPGSVICPTMHGTRCLLAEIQALTATGILGAARRKASGLDLGRLAMLVAVLEKHGGLRLADQDIFVAAVGGLRINEPAADLATALAIAGVHLGRTLGAGVAVIGEVALSGQVRPVGQLEQRVREARRRGANTVIVPRTGTESGRSGSALIPVDRLSEALQQLG